jgi:hypothetical protein
MVKFVQGAHEAHARLVYQITHPGDDSVIIGPGTHVNHLWIVDSQTGTTVTDVVRRGISTNREEDRLCDEVFRVIRSDRSRAEARITLTKGSAAA